MDAQQMHDEEMSKRPSVDPASKGRLEALLAAKSASSSNKGPSSELGPIERAMRNNPTLTRETAEKMADESGF